jgi:broad specificity phosphatase PhoE
MSQLILIRHGQARTYEKDSDQLTPLGETQACALGKYWGGQGLVPDEIYSGSLIRQQRTAEICRQQIREYGLFWPEHTILPAFNEYDSTGILTRLLHVVAERDAAFRELAEASKANHYAPDRNRYFQRMFEAITTIWMKGEVTVEGVESWADFKARVRGAFKKILSAEGSGRTVAVFTSGGVIGVAVQTALNAPDAQALEINWRIRNASLTEFVFGKGRLSLDSFNTIPHLQDSSLHSFR